jgi:hypothetical protein
VSGIFLPLRVKSLPLATIYEVKIPLRKWKKSLLQRNPAQMTSAIVCVFCVFKTLGPVPSSSALISMSMYKYTSESRADELGVLT